MSINACLRSFLQPRAVVITTFCLLATLSGASATTLDEAALRLALSVSREFVCPSTNETFTIAALPIEDESNTLSDDAINQLEADFLRLLLAELTPCVEVTDVTSALETLTYLQNIGSWRELGEQRRIELRTQLAGAEAILTTSISRVGGAYSASVNLTSLTDGLMIANAGFGVPEQFTNSSCGATAASEERGLERLATALIDRLGQAAVIHLAPATYQDGTEASAYGSYLTDQFIAELTVIGNDVISDSAIRILRHPASNVFELSEGDHEISLRYWPCDDLSAVRLVVVASSAEGDVITMSQELSLSALPAGLDLVPSSTGVEPTEALPLEGQPPVLPSDAGDIDVGFMSVNPRLANVGDVLTVIAEPPASCTPFFFDLSPGGRLTSIPLDIFNISEIRPGMIQYVNDSGSQYGIIIQLEDEPGIHRLGYICQPASISEEGVREIFRRIRGDFAERQSGTITVEDYQVVFNTSFYEILR